MPRPHTSHSAITLARKCSRAWWYKYVMRIVRKRPFRKPLIGTILHEMLKAHVKARTIDNYTNDPWKVLAKYKKQYEDLFREEKEEYGDIPAIVTAIFEGYLRRWRDDGLEWIGVEVPVVTPLTDEIDLQAELDGIVRQVKTGLRFLLERKFHKILPKAQDRFADIQTLLYFWAWNREHGPEEQLAGVVWDYGRMKAPSIPEQLKNKELTRRKDIDTDPFTYMEAIRTHGLNPRDYTETLALLKGKETSFFERVYLPSPPKAMIEQVVEDARITAITRTQMGDIAPRDGMSMFNCKTCEYRAICEAEIRGHDAEFVRKRDYKDREKEDVHGDEED